LRSEEAILTDDGLYESLRKSHRAGEFRRRLTELGVNSSTESDVIKVVEDDSLPFQARTIAVAALGKEGVVKAVPAIRQGLESATPKQADLGCASIVALYRLQGHDADDAFQMALGSKSEAVRRYANGALNDEEFMQLMR
jgi:HEAT repeat protein